MSFCFDNIVIYKLAEERVRRNRYGRSYWGESNSYTRDGDVLIKFTTEKHATEEAMANHAYLVKRFRELGAKYLIQGLRGPQVLFALDTHERSRTEIVLKLFKEYESAHDRAWKQQREKYYSSLYTPVYNSRVGTAIACTGLRKNHGHVMPRMTGFYDLETGGKITKRTEILERLWDLDFLAERSTVLYAADYRLGSPKDIDFYNNMMPQIKTLDSLSPLRSSIESARRKISKSCDFPARYL